MIHTDLETWLLDYHDEKMFAVYEKVNEKWIRVCEYAIIHEAIELPNSDVLLGFKHVLGDKRELSETIFYEHLSKIKLEDVTKEYE